jgi:hypothetical protein
LAQRKYRLLHRCDEVTAWFPVNQIVCLQTQEAYSLMGGDGLFLLGKAMISTPVTQVMTVTPAECSATLRVAFRSAELNWFKS